MFRTSRENMDDYDRVPFGWGTVSTRVLLCAVTIEELIVLSSGKWGCKLHRRERQQNLAAFENDPVKERRDDDTVKNMELFTPIPDRLPSEG